jgi:AbrB family looped-hinge helix DNA binding protein
MTHVTRLSAKGQVVIPKQVRDALGLNAGQALTVRRTGSGVTLTPVVDKSGRSTEEILADLRKIYTHEGPPVTLEEMDKAVARMFTERGGDF